jgi:hypothetical protein
MSNSDAGFLDSVMSAIRENPWSAALVGGGALWMLVGTEKLKGAVKSATAAASPLVDIGSSNVLAASSEIQRTAAPPTVPDLDQETSLHTGESLRGVGSTVSDAVSATADKVKEGINDGTAYARESLGNLSNTISGKETLASAQSSLAEILERQPLVLGVVGLAIGAAIAGAFRASDLENEWVGELSDEVKSDLSTRAGAVSQTVREASDTLQAEVVDASAEAVDRIKQAGSDAADAAREQTKST